MSQILSSSAYAMPGLKGRVELIKKSGLDFVKHIVYEVCQYYAIKEELLYSKTRKHEIVLCRQIVCFISRQLTSLTLKSIGGHFYQDHTSCIHAIKTIKDLIDTDSKIKEDISNIKKRLL